ncbi:FAD-binding oxidoreductase [Bradyrhizobium japonicum]|uniref:FAD-binding oxidoreductase n=1 Tax=Bradyrhizobium japonicum TaxID=375 RepID=UPI002010A750|nr:FAD-binding oxidoreductase [Bradyrhizobium japonicum]UQD95255.1 FAD-binding oxidoreductase [Bradyrhizobium japonicum]WLB23434.1 FAD-binding oxidoreductase [Bradyrhizobium japonicum]
MLEKTQDIDGALRRLSGQLEGRISTEGDEGYKAACAIWAKPVGRQPRAIVHCRAPQDIQFAVAAARSADLPLSVRGGGHDWAGRALCDGIVLDLGGMRDVVVEADIAWVSGGSRASDLLAATDPLGLAAVTGSCSTVGMAGLTLGGGYGPLNGRFGLALDNLIAADVVLSDGRLVIAERGRNEDLFWALRGGGGNFGVVTAMRIQLHQLPFVVSGALVYPFSQARDVLRRYADVARFAPDELTVQVVAGAGPDGTPVIMIVPTWSGSRDEAGNHLAPFLELGTALSNTVGTVRYGSSVSLFDPAIVNGQRVFMETCLLPVLDEAGIDMLSKVMGNAPSAGCSMITHEFKGAASQVPLETTAFGLRRDHVSIEILASFDDGSRTEERRHRQWVREAREAFTNIALPGGYPNMLGEGEVARAAASFGQNADRLLRAKRLYDPDNVFRSAIPLPIVAEARAREV